MSQMTVRILFALIIAMTFLYGFSAAIAEASIHWCRTC
jgi:hypothetical protein